MAIFRELRPSTLVDIGMLTTMRIAAIGIGLVYVKIYTNVLTPESIGVFFYLATLSYILNALFFVPLDYYFQSYFATCGEKLPLRVIGRITTVALAASGALISVLGALLVMLGQLEGRDVLSLFAMAVALSGCITLRNLLNNRGHRHVAAAALLFESAARVLVFLGLTLAFAPSGRLLFVSAMVGLFLELAALVVYAARRLSWTGEPGQLVPTGVLRTVMPISIAAGCNLIQSQSYRPVYTWAGVSASAASFAVVANIGAAGMAAAGQVFSQMLTPRIYKSDGTYLGRYVLGATLLTILVAAIAWFFSETLVTAITSSQYRGYAKLMVVGVAMEGANLIVAAITARSTLQGDTRSLMMWNVAGAAVALAGYCAGMALIPNNPAAIGAGLLASQAVVVGGLLINLRRRPR